MKKENRRLQCFACHFSVELVVVTPEWHPQAQYCVERSAEIIGLRPTDKGPACPVHVGMAVVRERK